MRIKVHNVWHIVSLVTIILAFVCFVRAWLNIVDMNVVIDEGRKILMEEAEVGEQLNVLLDVQDLSSSISLDTGLGIGLVALGYTLYGIGIQFRESRYSMQINEINYQLGKFNAENIMVTMNDTARKVTKVNNKLNKIEKAIKLFSGNVSGGNKN